MAAPSFSLRPAADSDADAVIAIIAACYALYDNCVLDVDAEEPELRAPHSAFAAKGTDFRVATDATGRLIGCIGLSEPKRELIKLYLDPACHGQGLGRQLAQSVIDDARRSGWAELTLWTDTRFTAAHRLYEKLGFVRGPETRDLNDLSDTVEYHYRLQLTSADSPVKED